MISNKTWLAFLAGSIVTALVSAIVNDFYPGLRAAFETANWLEVTFTLPGNAVVCGFLFALGYVFAHASLTRSAHISEPSIVRTAVACWIAGANLSVGGFLLIGYGQAVADKLILRHPILCAAALYLKTLLLVHEVGSRMGREVREATQKRAGDRSPSSP